MIASKKEVKAEPKQETVSRARYLIGTLYTPPVASFFPLLAESVPTRSPHGRGDEML